MSERPTAGELLEAARESLLQDLLPALPREQHYEGLMIANVMAISAREIEVGEQFLHEQIRRIRALGINELAAGTDLPAAERLARLEEGLVAEIRRRRFEGEAWESLRGALLEMTRARLRVSNPKYLRDWDSERESAQSERSP